MKKIKLLTLLMAAPMLWSCSADDPMPPQTETAAVEDPNFIPLDEAIKNADKHFADFFGDNTRSGRKVENVEFLGMRTRGDSNDDTHGFYVVNYENNGGFALLSADRRRESVYGISEEGSLHLSDTVHNKNLGWYINELLHDTRKTGIIPGLNPNPVNPIDTGLHEFVGVKTWMETIHTPILKGFYSRFHQDYPYNKYCRTKNGEQAPVGCVPLAVGTIIGYYEWPEYIDGYKLPWYDMRVKVYSDGWSHLFELIGGKNYLDVNYKPDGAGSTAYMAQQTFGKLGYTGCKRDDFIPNIVDSELGKGIPVIAYSNIGGNHMWIVDGARVRYEQVPHFPDNSSFSIYITRYYHCVWGENGTGNGYFLYSFSEKSLGGTPVEYDGDSDGSVPVYKDIDICYGYRPTR